MVIILLISTVLSVMMGRSPRPSPLLPLFF